MNEGWIKLHRKFLEWEWFELSEMVKLFVYFLLKANHKSNNWKGIKVERGQLITGRKKLSKELRMSEQKVRTCIERLKSTNEITMQSTNKYSIITVCNYDNYNTIDNKKQPTKQPVSNQETTSKQPTSNQQITTNKNDKNGNNEKNGKKKNEFDLIFEEFIKMRNKIKKPLTEKAEELILKKLNKLTDNENDKISILEQSIENSWQGVFPLKESQIDGAARYKAELKAEIERKKHENR